MKTSFAVFSLIWLAMFAATNLTGIVPTVRSLVSTKKSDKYPLLLGQMPDKRLVVQTGDDDARAIMTDVEYQKAHQHTTETDAMPFIVLVMGLAVAYLISGVNIINEWDRRGVMRLGKYVRTAGPGFAWIDPVLHKTLTDRTIRDTVKKIEIEHLQTHDNVPIALKMVLTWKHSDVKASIVNVLYSESALEERAFAAVTHAVGECQLDELMHKRGALQGQIATTLQAAVSGWGMDIIAVQVKDLQITDEAIGEAISMKARASKEADAELVRAKMQLQIAEHLNAAAKEYTADGKWLKGLETITELTRSAENNTVLVPTSMIEMLSGARGV